MLLESVIVWRYIFLHIWTRFSKIETCDSSAEQTKRRALHEDLKVRWFSGHIWGTLL